MKLGNPAISRERSFLFVLVILIVYMESSVAGAPVVFANPPSLDCGGGSCMAVAATQSSGSSVTVSGNLSTTASTVLIIAIETISNTGQPLVAPTISPSTTMSGPLCSSSTSNPEIAIYYASLTSSLSGATISATVVPKHGNTATLIAFGVSGYSTTTTFDGTCAATSGTSATSPSQSISGLTNGNDFVFAGIGIATDNPSATSPTIGIANTGAQVTTYSGDAGYQQGTGSQGTFTLAFSTSAGASWAEIVAAVNSSSPQAVPDFPLGVLPIILAVSALYLVIRARFARSRTAVGADTVRRNEA